MSAQPDAQIRDRIVANLRGLGYDRRAAQDAAWSVDWSQIHTPEEGLKACLRWLGTPIDKRPAPQPPPAAEPVVTHSTTPALAPGPALTVVSGGLEPLSSARPADLIQLHERGLLDADDVRNLLGLPARPPQLVRDPVVATPPKRAPWVNFDIPWPELPRYVVARLCWGGLWRLGLVGTVWAAAGSGYLPWWGLGAAETAVAVALVVAWRRGLVGRLGRLGTAWRCGAACLAITSTQLLPPGSFTGFIWPGTALVAVLLVAGDTLATVLKGRV